MIKIICTCKKINKDILKVFCEIKPFEEAYGEIKKIKLDPLNPTVYIIHECYKNQTSKLSKLNRFFSSYPLIFSMFKASNIRNIEVLNLTEIVDSYVSLKSLDPVIKEISKFLKIDIIDIIKGEAYKKLPPDFYNIVEGENSHEKRWRNIPLFKIDKQKSNQYDSGFLLASIYDSHMVTIAFTNILMNVVSRSIELRDMYTGGHSLRVAKLSELFANYLLKMKAKYKNIENDIKNLPESGFIFLSGLLHDLGKIFVPMSLLRKQYGWSLHDHLYLQLHTIHPIELLGDLNIENNSRIYDLIYKSLKKSLLDPIKNHHKPFEWKSSEPLSLMTKIISITDKLDALKTTRSYKEGLPWLEIFLVLYCESCPRNCSNCKINAKQNCSNITLKKFFDSKKGFLEILKEEYRGGRTLNKKELREKLHERIDVKIKKLKEFKIEKMDHGTFSFKKGEYIASLDQNIYSYFVDFFNDQYKSIKEIYNQENKPKDSKEEKHGFENLKDQLFLYYVARHRENQTPLGEKIDSMQELINNMKSFKTGDLL